MSDKEQRVRDAAIELNDAIIDARAAGYRIIWPALSDGLATIAISETARVGGVAKPAPGDEYEHMHKASLVELATGRGISVPSGSNKADVIALLKNPPVTGL